MEGSRSSKENCSECLRIAYCFHVFKSGGFIHSRVRDPQTGLHRGRRDIPYAQQTVASCDRTWQPRRCRPASPSSPGRRPFRELHVRYNLASRTCRPPKVPARGSFFSRCQHSLSTALCTVSERRELIADDDWDDAFMFLTATALFLFRSNVRFSTWSTSSHRRHCAHYEC